MLALMAVPMWASLLVIIPLEAFVATRRLGTGWGRSLKVAAIANLVSTVVGVPLTWLVLAAGEIGVQYAGSLFAPPTGPQHPLSPLAGVAVGAVNMILMAPWLVPYEGSLYWMIPTAALLLCVPFFFVSVWIEYLVARRMMGRERASQARDWAWRGNLWSYSLLVLVPLVLLGRELVRHHRTANDDVHRSVDTVAMERVWDLALARVKQEKAESSQSVVVGDARPAAETHADSLWRAGDDARRAGDARAAETRWRAALLELDRGSAPTEPPVHKGAISAAEVLSSLARLYSSQARYADAIPLYERLRGIRDAHLAEHPHDSYFSPGYPQELVAAYDHLGQSERAERYCQHVVEQQERLHDADDRTLLWALAELADHRASRGDSASAESLYVHIIGQTAGSGFLSDEPAVERSYHELVGLYRRQRRLAEAERLLSGGIARQTQYQGGEFPDSSSAGPLFVDLALVYLDQGELPQAQHYAKSALRWGPRLQDAAEVYAQVLDHEGRTADAESWRRKASSAPQ